MARLLIREAGVRFKGPYVRCVECEVIALAVIVIVLRISYGCHLWKNEYRISHII